jgi:BirA family biotin operon repressor/biotin-[acetyl-CoA-carboxylase] ligase
MQGAAILAHCAGGANAIGPTIGTAVDIEVVDETGSTNADLLARVDAGTLAGPTLRIALHQTAGRGRAGRSWLSAPGSTLMFSLAWTLRGPLGRLAGLPLAVGVSLAESLIELGLPVTLKWPNDVLRDGAKLAGILVETRTGANGELWAVIGAGINLLMPDDLEERIGRNVASAPWLAQMDRNVLMAALLNRLADTLGEFDTHGFAPFAPRWNRLHAYRGQAVRILEQERELHAGRAAGVDDSGRLLLDSEQGRIAVMSGDVSLRPAQA